MVDVDTGVLVSTIPGDGEVCRCFAKSNLTVVAETTKKLRLLYDGQSYFMSQLLTNKLEIYVDLLDKHVKILIKPQVPNLTWRTSICILMSGFPLKSNIFLTDRQSSQKKLIS